MCLWPMRSIGIFISDVALDQNERVVSCGPLRFVLGPARSAFALHRKSFSQEAWLGSQLKINAITLGTDLATSSCQAARERQGI